MRLVRQFWESFDAWWPGALGAALVLVLTWAIARSVDAVVRRVLKGRRSAAAQVGFFVTVGQSVVWVFGLISALDLLGLGGLASGLMAGSGVVAVALGFAFREIGENFLAGALLAFSPPFRIGDYIRSADHEGRVVSLDLRTTHIRTADGRDVYLPNAQIITQPLENFTVDGLRRPAFTVGIDYSDDVGRALVLLRDATAALDDVLAEPAPRVRVAELDGAWVTIEVSCWADTTKTTRPIPLVRSDAMEACRQALRAEGFTLSCDTTTAIALHPSSKVQVEKP